MAIEDDIYNQTKDLFIVLIDSHLRDQRLAGEKMGISDLEELYGIVEVILSSKSFNDHIESIIDDVIALAEADGLVEERIKEIEKHPLPEE